MDRVFESAPLHLQPSVGPRINGESRGIGVGIAQRLYPARREKMVHAAFKKLAVQRIDDANRS